MKAQILTYVEGQDPKEIIFDAVKDDLPKLNIYGNRVLVATAPHMERSKGGIIFTDKVKEENRYQGKVGLVLKLGPSAFKYDGSYEWEGDKPVIGSWVFYRTPDSWECGIAGVSCRFIRDSYVIGEVAEPNMIW